jgi:hypothetical protein
MMDPDLNGGPIPPPDDEPFTAGEKVASVLEAAHHLVMHHEPAAQDRGEWVKLWLIRKLVDKLGGVDGVLAMLPPLEDAERWDGLLQLGAGILLELRADDAEPFDTDQAREYGAQWIGALMADTSGVGEP